MEYDVFVSYARADNRDGWVDGLVEVLREDHLRYSAAELRVYQDTRETRLTDDWKVRLRQALRNSRVLLVCVSPSYFASQYCRFEWEEFVAYRGQSDASADTVASVYFVQVNDPVPADLARWQEAVGRVQHLDAQPWFPLGRAALAQAEVRARLAELGDQIWSKGQRALAPVVGNLKRPTSTFVGRVPELTDLREQVLAGRVGVVTAVHGLGGQGKTELASAYAHVNRAGYGGGTWSVAAEGLTSMTEAVARLAPDVGLAADPGTAAEVVARRVLIELQRRTGLVDDPRNRNCLLVLDNVDSVELLSRTGTELVGEQPWLHVLVTTRLGEAELAVNRTGLAFRAIDGLDEDDTYRLLREYQPGKQFRTPAADAEARALAALLVGFTLATEQAAIYLAANPDVSPASLHGSITSGSHAELDSTRLGTRHAGTMAAVLEATWAQLPQRARDALGVAALLPPDWVLVDWLEELTVGEGEQRWPRIQRVIEGRRLLTPGGEPGCRRMHRLIRDWVCGTQQGACARAAPELDALLDRIGRDGDLAESSTPATPVTAYYEAVALRAEQNPDLVPVLARAAGRCLDRLPVAVVRDVSERCEPALRDRAEQVPDDAGTVLDLAYGLLLAGDVQRLGGDDAGAVVKYLEALACVDRWIALTTGDPDWGDRTVRIPGVMGRALRGLVMTADQEFFAHEDPVPSLPTVDRTYRPPVRSWSQRPENLAGSGGSAEDGLAYGSYLLRSGRDGDALRCVSTALLEPGRRRVPALADGDYVVVADRSWTAADYLGIPFRSEITARASLHALLGDVHWRLGQVDLARAAYRVAASMAEDARVQNPDDRRAHGEVLLARVRLALTGDPSAPWEGLLSFLAAVSNDPWGSGRLPALRRLASAMEAAPTPGDARVLGDELAAAVREGDQILVTILSGWEGVPVPAPTCPCRGLACLSADARRDVQAALFRRTSAVQGSWVQGVLAHPDNNLGRLEERRASLLAELTALRAGDQGAVERWLPTTEIDPVFRTLVGDPAIATTEWLKAEWPLFWRYLDAVSFRFEAYVHQHRELVEARDPEVLRGFTGVPGRE